MQCSRLAAMAASSIRSSSVKLVGSAVHTPLSNSFAASFASFLRYFIGPPSGASIVRDSAPRGYYNPRPLPAQLFDALDECRQHLAVVVDDPIVCARENLGLGAVVDRDHGACC